MGKKRFNAKARNVSDRVIDDKETKNIQIEFPEVAQEYGGNDEANALVLPSKKRATKAVKAKQDKITRILSKKQRKLLEKVVDKKKKKEGRAALLEALTAVQVSQDELKNYTSISQIQTIGLKNLHKIDQDIKTVQGNTVPNVNAIKISSIAGKSKRKRLALLSGYNDIVESSDEEICKKTKNDVLGFDKDIDDMSTDTETENEDEDEETVNEENKIKEESNVEIPDAQSSIVIKKSEENKKSNRK